MKKWLEKAMHPARKAIERAARKRAERKTPYPVGFEYRSDRK